MAPRRKQQNLAGKLLLSTALVAVTLAYGWWQRPERDDPDRAIPQFLKPPTARPAANGSVPVTARAELTAPVTKAAPNVGSDIESAVPRSRGPASATELPRQDRSTPGSALPLTAMAELRMYQPPPLQTPLPLITGTPAADARAPIPQNAYLQDGDYLSDTQQFEWGDLQVKILVHGGQIMGAQLVQYPDHRAESLEISQRASPLLNSEVIRTQQAKVDIVSSATDTSYVYRDAIANVLAKATQYRQ